MNSTDLITRYDSVPPSNSSSFVQFDSTSGSDVTGGDQSAAAASHFVLHPPASAMLGVLSVQTVSFILLGVGAAAPILLVTSVAVVLRLRRIRRRHKYSKYVFNHDDDCRDAWREHDAGEPVQRRKEANGVKPPTGTDGTRRTESVDAMGGIVPHDVSVARSYPLSGHDLDSVIKTFFGLTRDYTKSSPSSTFKEDPLRNLAEKNDNPDGTNHVPTKSPTTLLNVRALVEANERRDSFDSVDLSRCIPGAGQIHKDDTASGRLGIPTRNGIVADYPYGGQNSGDSIRRSVDSSIGCRSETFQIFFQSEELGGKTTDDGEEEEKDRRESGNISGSQGTSIYFDAESSPSGFRNATLNFDHEAAARRSSSSFTDVYSSYRQGSAVAPVFGLEEEQVLRCLDEVLLEYMDHGDGPDTRTEPGETNATAHL